MTAPSQQPIIADRYALQQELTRGGMGAVWVAHDRRLDREVAVKLMLPAEGGHAASRPRFEREARAVAALASQHVVQIFDFGVDAGAPFLVMELLRGEDLGARLKRLSRIPVAGMQAICGQIAKALAAAHDAGLVHRDLKPSNVFLARIDGDEVVKVLDFGIAKAHGPTPEGELTKTGMLLGTPQYMSPEQLRSAKRVDLRSDLWALGALLFQCITGTHAFTGESLADLILAITIDPIPAPSQVCPGLPSDVDAFFSRALQREPDARFQSAREMAEAFSRIAPFAQEPTSARPPPIDRITREDTAHDDTRRRRVDRDAATEVGLGATPEEEQIAFVEWDESEGVATVLLKPGAVGRTAESIAAWKRQVSAQLDRFGRKVPLLICVDGGVVSPSLAEQFGAAAKAILDRYATSFARYGTASGLRMISAVESMKRGYKPNLFNDRASALAFLKGDTAAPGAVK
jgi:hypothetical protein